MRISTKNPKFKLSLSGDVKQRITLKTFQRPSYLSHVPVMSGGIIGKLLSNTMINNKIDKAVDKVENLINQGTTEADQYLDLFSDPSVTQAVTAIGQAYVKRASLGGSPTIEDYYNQLPKKSSILSEYRSIPLVLTTKSSKPLVFSSDYPAIMMMAGGLWDKIKSVGKKVISTVAKVADIPVVGDLVKSIPGIGTAVSAISTVDKLVNKSDNNSTTSDTQSNSDTSQIQDIASSAAEKVQDKALSDNTVAAIKSVAQGREVVQNPTAAAAVLEAVPLEMSSVQAVREAKTAGASLIKNAAILGYALGGDPVTIKDSVDLVIAISSIPYESAIANSITIQPGTGVWRVDQGILQLLPGVTATDMTSALQVLVDIASMRAQGVADISDYSNLENGVSAMLPVIGSAYFAAAIPSLAAQGQFSAISQMIADISLVAPPSIAQVCAAQCADFTPPSVSIYANWMFIPLLLQAKIQMETATDSEKKLYEALTTIASSIISAATATDITAMRSLYPAPLSIASKLIARSNCWQTSEMSPVDQFNAWLMSEDGMTIADSVISAKKADREDIIKTAPSSYRSALRSMAQAYDSEGQTGAEKVLRNIGSYISSTVTGLFS